MSEDATSKIISSTYPGREIAYISSGAFAYITVSLVGWGRAWLPQDVGGQILAAILFWVGGAFMSDGAQAIAGEKSWLSKKVTGTADLITFERSLHAVIGSRLERRYERALTFLHLGQSAASAAVFSLVASVVVLATRHAGGVESAPITRWNLASLVFLLLAVCLVGWRIVKQSRAVAEQIKATILSLGESDVAASQIATIAKATSVLAAPSPPPPATPALPEIPPLQPLPETPQSQSK